MIHIIIGTKAQLIKMAPVLLRLQEEDIPYNFILTGQHRETMDDLRENFSIKPPDLILHSGRDVISIPHMVLWLLTLSLKTLFRRTSIFRGGRRGDSIVMVHGDTVSTLVGAVMGRIARLPVAHVEAGLRSFNRWNPFPEELIRHMSFRLSDIYFCPGQWAVDNLKQQRGMKINTKYNTLLDALAYALRAKTPGTLMPVGPYCITSVHRFENLSSRSACERTVSLIETVARYIRVVFILHPVTDRTLTRFNLRKRLEKNPSIELHPRYDYFTFIHLLNRSAYMVSDGGSNQEESFYLGKPCLLLRAVTERTEGMRSNVVLSNYDKERVVNFVEHYGCYRMKPVRSDVSPSDIIVGHLRKYAGVQNEQDVLKELTIKTSL